MRPRMPAGAALRDEILALRDSLHASAAPDRGAA
jgi:hypothetical protein